MRIQARVALIKVLIGLWALMLSLALTQCKSQPSPPEDTPSSTQSFVAEGTTVAPGTTVIPAAATHTPAPTPTLTKEEQLVQEVVQSDSLSKPSFNECDGMVIEHGQCRVVKSAVRITRPEWEALFPQAEFFVVKRDIYRYDNPFPAQRNLLIVEQGGQRYGVRSFHHLLEANDITTISDENRELVAKAFALMTIPDYLEGEIQFFDLEEINVQGGFSFERYNYAITVWTQIQGLKIRWRFMINEGLLIAAEGFVPEYNVGDYVDVPFDYLPLPSDDDFRYWRK